MDVLDDHEKGEDPYAIRQEYLTHVIYFEHSIQSVYELMLNIRSF